MKKAILFSVLTALSVSMFSACSNNPNIPSDTGNNTGIDTTVSTGTTISESPDGNTDYDQRTQVTDDWKFVYDKKLGGIKILDCLCVQKRGGSRVYNPVDDIVVPKTFEGFEGAEVLEIGERVFAYIEGCNSITLPDTVKYIDGAVFSSSNIKQTVVIPDSVIDMSDGAFAYSYCNIQLPSNIKKIGKSLFEGSSFTHIEIPESVEEIEDLAFSGCTNLVEITIGENVKTIGYGAFSSCYKLEKVTFNSALKEIGEKAFYNCGDLKTIEFKEGLEKIGKNAFLLCDKLGKTVIELPDSLTAVVCEEGYNSKKLPFPHNIDWNTKQFVYKGTSYTADELSVLLGVVE